MPQRQIKQPRNNRFANTNKDLKREIKDGILPRVVATHAFRDQQSDIYGRDGSANFHVDANIVGTQGKLDVQYRHKPSGETYSTVASVFVDAAANAPMPPANAALWDAEVRAALQDSLSGQVQYEVIP